MFIASMCYLLLPVFLFCFTFLSAPFCILSAVALILFTFCAYRSYASHDCSLLTHGIHRYWPLIFVAAVTAYVCTVSPFHSVDWSKHYAFFNLLTSKASWPPVLEFDGHTWFLRHHLAWYLVPTLLAKMLGKQFIVLAVFVWTTIGLSIALLLAFHNLRKAKHLFVAALVFLFFSGLDIVGAWLANKIEPLNLGWIQWWAGLRLFGVLPTFMSLQYAPHHILVACVATCLFLYNRRLAVQHSLLIITVAVLWSSFVVIGLLPIVVWSLFREGYKKALTMQNLLVAPLLAIPILLYATLEAGYIPRMFVWNDQNFQFHLYIMFIVFELALIQLILFYLLKDKRGLLIIISLFVAVVSLFKMGDWSDLLNRAAMPTFIIMSIWMVKALLENSGWRREVLVAYLLVGAVTSVVSLVIAISPSTLRVDKNMTLQQYLVWEIPSPQVKLKDYTSYFMVKISDAIKPLNIPLLRGIERYEQTTSFEGETGK